jgi:hypothetical protein
MRTAPSTTRAAAPLPLVDCFSSAFTAPPWVVSGGYQPTACSISTQVVRTDSAA